MNTKFAERHYFENKVTKNDFLFEKPKSDVFTSKDQNRNLTISQRCNQTVKPKKQKKTFKCIHCGKYFLRDDLVVHKKITHKKESSIKAIDDRSPTNKRKNSLIKSKTNKTKKNKHTK